MAVVRDTRSRCHRRPPRRGRGGAQAGPIQPVRPRAPRPPSSTARSGRGILKPQARTGANRSATRKALASTGQRPASPSWRARRSCWTRLARCTRRSGRVTCGPSSRPGRPGRGGA